jgi:hypothetical protein
MEPDLMKPDSMRPNLMKPDLTTLEVSSSIERFTADEWNRLFPGELEDWSYYRATERARLAGFEWLYFGVRVDSELRAVVPAFITDYRLDTTLDGRLRRVVGALARAAPGLLRPRMLALGSPVSETCHAGYDPHSTQSERLRRPCREARRTAARGQGRRRHAIDVVGMGVERTRHASPTRFGDRDPRIAVCDAGCVSCNAQPRDPQGFAQETTNTRPVADRMAA